MRPAARSPDHAVHLTPKGENRMARPSKFAHIVYRTRRFDEMVDWYEKVFEARVQYRNPALAFLTYDDEHHRFAFANLSVLDPAGGTSDGRADGGVDHVAYTYASLGDLVDTYERLKRQGIVPYWPIRHGPTLSLYYRDPDGNRMEFQVDCFATAEEANAYLHGEAFAANPIGVTFDPEALVAQFRRGVPERELLARPDGAPSPIPREHGLGA
jgi:catechol 2,3-dioxygenase-like lactoylglutathione lyase family enzyme